MDARVIEQSKNNAGKYPNVNFFCGWCAGCVETCVLFPLSKITFRQQLYGIVLKDAMSQVCI